MSSNLRKMGTQSFQLCVLTLLTSCSLLFSPASETSDAGSPAPDDRLRSLTISTAAAVTPSFSAAQLAYSLNVSVVVSEIRVTPTAFHPNASITVNGTNVESGTASERIALDLGENSIVIEISQSRVYTLAVNRGARVIEQLIYGKASNTNSDDQLGVSVSLSGDTLAVGARRESSGSPGVDGDQDDNGMTDSGAVYIFVREGSTWKQQAYIKASNPGENDLFGENLSLAGDTLAVGAAEEDSKATGVNGEGQGDDSLNNSGAVYVYTRTGSIWSQQAYIKASNSGGNDFFGVSVSLSGNCLAVGANKENSGAVGVNGDQGDDSAAADSGAVYVFTRLGSLWKQQAYIKASNTDGTDSFGISVSLSDNSLAVGADNEDSNATGVNGIEDDNSTTGSGAVYLFERNGNMWSQMAYIKASNTGQGDSFGRSVSLFGDTLAVGADREDSNAMGVNGIEDDNDTKDSGAVYIFSRNSGEWSQQAYIKASNSDRDDLFGARLSLSANTLAVGASREDSDAIGINGIQNNNSADDSGAVYVFTRNNKNEWNQEAYIKASNSEMDDRFGASVSLSGDTLAVGGHHESSQATGIGGDEGDNSSSESGAFYIFE